MIYNYVIYPLLLSINLKIRSRGKAEAVIRSNSLEEKKEKKREISNFHLIISISIVHQQIRVESGSRDPRFVRR